MADHAGVANTEDSLAGVADTKDDLADYASYTEIADTEDDLAADALTGTTRYKNN